MQIQSFSPQPELSLKPTINLEVYDSHQSLGTIMNLYLYQVHITLMEEILWPNYSTPLYVVSLRFKLPTLWKYLGKHGLISLGRVSLNLPSSLSRML